MSSSPRWEHTPCRKEKPSAELYCSSWQQVVRLVMWRRGPSSLVVPAHQDEP